MTGLFTTFYERSAATRLPLAPWADDLREKGWKAFQSVGLPTRAHEEWKYTSLRSLGDLEFVPAITTVALDHLWTELLARHSSPEDLILVFVNGALSTALSHLQALPAGVNITSVGEALAQNDSSLRSLLSRHVSTLRAEHGVHAFGALSDAFARDGVVVQIARGVKVERPIHILHVVTPDAHDGATAYFPRHVIHLAERAEAHVVETYTSATTSEGQKDQAPYLVTAFTDLILDSAARLTHLRVQAEGPTGTHVALARAALERDAYLGTFSLAAGGRLARVDLDITLKASGAEVDLDGLYMVRGSQHVDHHTVVEHCVPNAISRQLYKGILAESGRAVFNGKVLVREGAHGTNAFQLNQNLLLSSDAEIDTKPELQIDADDVKCSHGAAIGQLEADQIFYLQSRGLTKEASKKLLCAAFADDVLLKVKTPGRFAALKRLTMDYVTL